MQLTVFRILIVAIWVWHKLCNAYNGYYAASDIFEDQKYWERIGRDEVDASFRRPVNWKLAKNIIVMVADGMDPNTVTATRIHKETDRGKLSFERFPHMGLLKTYSINKKVPDAAATGTALFTGVKTNNQVVGLDSKVQHEDCMSSLTMQARVTSIMQWAQAAGKNTGFVTNKRVTDALPAALYANSASRHWECNNLPEHATMCKDIARQLIEDEIGRNFKVIFGGGRQCLESNVQHTRYYHVDQFTCQRTDGKNLIEEWSREKHQSNIRHKVIYNTGGLLELDTLRTEYTLGIFANSYFPYESERNRTIGGMPSLEMMVEPAIKILHKYQHSGFVLMIQGGLIDKAHHEGNARKAIEETIEFDKAVTKAIDVLYELGIKNDTLLIVTGGHGHTMSINGYPDRNASILGIAEKSKHDNTPYTILTYATGSKLNYQYNRRDDYVAREDPSFSDTTGPDYHQQAAILTDKETHGGGDVTVYATGPMSHMFYSVHEQTYVAYVIAYAGRFGPFGISMAVIGSPTLTMNFGLIVVFILQKMLIK